MSNVKYQISKVIRWLAGNSKNFERPYLLLIIALSLLPLLALLHPGMFAGHDAESHVARLVAFYQSLQEGNLIPRWAGNLNMGFGHPVLMFLYPLSNYIGSVWHFLGFSFVTSVKLTFAVSYVLSGIFMYLFSSEIFGKKAGFFISILYLFAPYRFMDFYVRAALGEHLAFMTMPLVLWSFTKLIKSDNTLYIILSSLSLGLLILSHNAISLMFLPFFFLYLIIAVWYLNRSRNTIYRTLLSLLLGFGFSSFFWLPALEEGKYTLRDILTKDDYISRFPALVDFFYSPWNLRNSSYLSKEIGWAQWIAVLAGIIFLAKNQKKNFTFWFIFLTEVGFWISFLLLNKISLPIWQTVTILQKFQFPWRFLSLSVLTSALLSVSVVLLFKKNLQLILLILLMVLASVSTMTFWQPKGFLKENDDFFKYNYRGTTDTGESSPKWSIRGMEQKPKAAIELIGGIGSIKQLKRNSTTHVYEVSAENEIQLLDNTVYFPGWEIVVDKSEKALIEYQDKNHFGLITFKIPKGKHVVEVRFTDTKLRSFANYLSLISFAALFGILVVKYVAFRRSRYL